MAQDILFLLAPFSNVNAGPGKFYCPECATLEGVLSYFPELQKKVDVRRVAFQRPRDEIVHHLGADLQSAPVLVVGEESRTKISGVQVSPATKRAYVSGLRPIADYLADAYHIDRLHP
jgi:hypothetical protein